MSRILALATFECYCDSYLDLEVLTTDTSSKKWIPDYCLKDRDASERCPTPFPCYRKNWLTYCAKGQGFPLNQEDNNRIQ